MTEISIDRAVWAGFRLVRQHPVAFLAWTGVYVVLGLGPVLLLMAVIGPEYVGFFQSAMNAAAAGTQPDVAATNALMAQMQGVQAISILAALVLYAVLYAAIFRAVLEPGNKRFAYLRLGADELRLGVLIAMLYVGVFVVVMVAVVLMGAVIAAAALMGSMIVAVVLGMAGFVGLVVGGIWLAARLSMVLPMTFERKTFMIGPAWALTRGHGWRLSLIVLLLLLIMLGMGLVVMLFYGVGAVTLMASIGDAAALTDYFSRPADALFRDLSPWVAIIALLSSVVSSLYMVVGAAPWAVAFRELAGDRTATEDVFA